MSKSVFTDAYALLLDTLIETRKHAKVSQAELGRRLGKPQPFISYIESGERRLDVIEFYAVMKALGADPEEIFSKLAHALPERVEI